MSEAARDVFAVFTFTLNLRLEKSESLFDNKSDSEQLDRVRTKAITPQNNMFDITTGYGYSSALAWIYFVVISILLGIVYLLFKQKKEKKEKKARRVR